jgi:general secretion pathway protein E
VEPFLVASSILGVLAQRLVRKLCSHCKVQYTPTDEELAEMRLTRVDVPGKVWRQVGCDECSGHGYRGRSGIFEFLPAYDEVKALVIANADAGSVARKAQELGMTTLWEDGVRKVVNGVTTFDEILRVTRDDSSED